MSLPGYKKKSKPALWMQAFPDQVAAPVAVSKRAHQSAYQSARKRFLKQYKGAECPVMFKIFGRHFPVLEIHHIRGRVGELLLDQAYWMAVSRRGHKWIHNHPAEAVALGWLAGKGEWGRQ